MRSVFIIGDSISIHYGPYLQKLLPFQYDRKNGEEQALVDLDNPMGGNGGDSSMVLEYLRDEKASGINYDILLINCGLHDVKTPVGGTIQIDIINYKENLRAIAELSQQIAHNFIWIRTTDAIDAIHNTPSMPFHRFHDDIMQYNEAADMLFESLDIPTIDLYGFSRSFGETAFLDHVHYKEEIRKLQAAYIAGYLQAKFN
jgi:lysophospholipase L1-like esterase